MATAMVLRAFHRRPCANLSLAWVDVLLGVGASWGTGAAGSAPAGWIPRRARAVVSVTATMRGSDWFFPFWTVRRAVPSSQNTPPRPVLRLPIASDRHRPSL